MKPEEEGAIGGQQTPHLDMASKINDPFPRAIKSMMMKLHNSIRKQKRHSEAKQVKEPVRAAADCGCKGTSQLQDSFCLQMFFLLLFALFFLQLLLNAFSSSTF